MTEETEQKTEKPTAWGKMFRDPDAEWTPEEEEEAMLELRRAVDEGELSRKDKARQTLEKEFEEYFGVLGMKTETSGEGEQG